MANLDPDLEYLSPDFEPSSYTVPKLRSVLVSHDVSYPSSAKKADLIELFNTQVAPKAKRILSARNRTKPSSRGIIDVPSSQVSVADDDDDDDLQEQTKAAAPARKPSIKKKTSRRTTEAQVEDEAETPEAATKSKTKRPASAKRTKSPTFTEPKSEQSTTKKPRKSRSSGLTPRSEDLDLHAWRQGDGDSPFTQDNPFQSGSSPPMGSDGFEGDRRRRTMGDGPKKSRKSDGSRRKTDIHTATSMGRKSRLSGVDFVEAGEEFTPEEQLDLEVERAVTGQLDVLPARRRHQSSHSSANTFKLAPFMIALALSGGLGTLWRQEKLEVGYCGVGRPSTSLGGIEIPNWASFLEPQCEPCPQHARCYKRLETVCDPDFVLTHHPLALMGAIPLPPTCEPDGEKVRKVKAVADRAVEEMRGRNAKFECGELHDEDGASAKSPHISEEELKKEVAARRKKGMTNSDFEELWQSAIGEVLGREEVESRDDGNGTTVLRSTSLAALPLGCAIRRSLRRTLARYTRHLVILSATLIVALVAYLELISYRATAARSRELASDALEMLARQASLHLSSPRSCPDAGIAMTQLRDDVLRSEFSARRRNKLWGRVQKLVEANSNVRSMVREARSGDITNVWEWVGALKGADSEYDDSDVAMNGAASSSISSAFTRDQRRVSAGNPLSRSASRSNLRGGSSRPNSPAMVERKGWDLDDGSRPIY